MSQLSVSDESLDRVSQKIFVVFAVVMLPALLASIARSFESDGAFGVVAMQITLYIWILVLAMPLRRFNYRQRLYSAFAISFFIGAGALIRNSDLSVLGWFVLASVLLSSVSVGRLRYIFIAIIFPAATFLSHHLWGGDLNYAISSGFAYAAMSLVVTLLVSTLVSSAKESTASERKLHLERDRALQQLQIEEQRRTAVSENANVAFFQFDYASGRCYGDATELARHGLTPDAEFWDVAKDVHLFAPESQELIQSQIAEVSQKPAGATAQFTLQMRVRPSNELRSFRISGQNVEVDGTLQFAGASIDITDEVRASEALEQKQSQLSMLAEAGDIGLFEHVLEENQVYVTRQILERLGIDSDDKVVPVEQFLGAVPAEAQSAYIAEAEKVAQLSIGESFSFTHPQNHADGSQRWIKVTGVITERDGHRVALGSAVDVTAEMKAVEKAEELSSLIELVSKAGGVGLIEFFPDTRTFKCNSEVSARLGLEHSELERDIELFYAHQTEEIRALFVTPREALAKSPNGVLHSFVHPFYLANGDLHHMRVSRIKREVNGRTSFLGLSLDITDEVQAKEQAERQAEQLNLLALSGAVAYFEVDFERGLIDGNALLKQRAGLPADAPAFPMAEIVSSIPVEARAEFEANVQRAIEAGLGGVTTFEHPYYKHDGELIYVRVTATTLMRDGRLHALGASVEITEAVQARQQAEKQADQLSLLALGGKVAFFEVDLARGMIDGNAVLKQRLGLPASAGGFSMEQLVESIPLDAREAFQKNVQNANEAGVGAVTVFEHPQYKYDGELIYVRVTATIILRHGHMYVQGAAVEITEAVAARKQAEQQADQLKLITEQGKIGLYEFDLEKGVIHANSVLCERFGVDPELGEISQEVMLDILAEDSRASALEHIEWSKTAPEGYFATSTVDHIFSDGSVHKIRIFEKLERRQGRPFYVGAAVDVTDEVQAREQAEAAMSKLAEEQDRQAQMYAVIGHELRTPAASLQMMLDDLGEGESLDAALARANIEQLLSVIDTLRAVAQPERMAQAAYDDVQLDEMLQQQAQNFQALATRHGIQLKTDFTGLTIHPVHIQKTLLRQVLSNLIKNALIHSGGTELEVGASGRVLEGGRKALRLWLADNGKGVSADKVEKLFEAFVRGSTEAEGTGLGLHICREIIQNMGGDLRYEPRPEGGACFVIELEVDLAKADPSEQLKPEAKESPLQGMRVLLAEDNKTIQMLTQKMLSKQGAQVTVGNNGKEALEAFEPGKFDLVLSDIFMPEMNGYEFAREVRCVDTAVPLIGLTAATIGKETDEMLAAGASAVLSKPISLSKLLDKLAEIELAQNPA